MKRAVKDLCQLADEELFDEVAVGIKHLHAAVDGLEAAAHKLAQDGLHHPARIMRNSADEEAAKIGILVDAVRCPPGRREERSRTLGDFYDHVAKGIDAEACGLRFADFNDLARWVEHNRVEYYLDGPDFVDWIFPNRFTQRREDDLYVGYVRDDSEETGKGERCWVRPHVVDMVRIWNSGVIRLDRALRQVGATEPDGLAVVAKVWRAVDVRPDMPFDELEQLNRRTLEMLEQADLVAAAPDDVRSVIVREWPFPLWPLDLRMRKVDKEDLRVVRRSRLPEGW